MAPNRLIVIEAVPIKIAQNIPQIIHRQVGIDINAKPLNK